MALLDAATVISLSFNSSDSLAGWPVLGQQIVVAGARQLDPAGAREARSHLATLLHRDDLVAGAMQDQGGATIPRDRRGGVPAFGEQEADEKRRKVPPRHIGKPTPRAHENQARHRLGARRRHLSGGRRSQRPTADHSRAVRSELSQAIEGGDPRRHQALLRRRSGAPPVSRIVDDQHHGVERPQAVDRAIAAQALEVLAVAVEEEHRASLRR
jgi:hypothetical protein